MSRLPTIAWILICLGLVALEIDFVSSPAPLYVGGIQVNEPDHDAWVEALDEAGLNTVAVTAYARQGDWDSSNLWWDAETEEIDGDDWVVNEIRTAERRGLHTVLVLRTALDHAFPRNKFLWHGMIQPKDEATLEEWFERYREFVVRWAAIAEREGVDVLAIGSELSSMTRTVRVTEIPALEEYWSNPDKVARVHELQLSLDPRADERAMRVRGHEDYTSAVDYLEDSSAAHADWARRVAYLDEPDPVAAINRRRERLDRAWRRVAAEARRHYSGSLTYAANFDQYEAVGFWDALDLIGINAYFPLLDEWQDDRSPERLEALFEARWKGLFAAMDTFRRSAGVPHHRVLFTEIGYIPREQATAQPWAAEGTTVLSQGGESRLVVWEEQPPDPLERALAIRALCGAARQTRRPIFGGLLYWKLSTVPSHREVEPFVVVVGAATPDPAAVELQRCSADLD